MSAAGNSERRVVVTGIGLVCPLGKTTAALWEALRAGRSGVSSVADLALTGLATTCVAMARDFTGSIEDFGDLSPEQKRAIRKGLKVMCRESQMGVAAAQRALADASIAAGGLDPERCGVVFGSDYMLTEPAEFNSSILACYDQQSHFKFNLWAAEGMTRMAPLWLLKYLPNMPASHIAIYNDFRGPNNSLTLREASSNLAVGEATRIIARGHADLMLAGATGTRVHPMKAIHAVLSEEVAGNGTPPAWACRPFDLDRQGMVLGEGACVLVLEEHKHAVRRGATILAEVFGCGSSTVTQGRHRARRDLAIANALASALRDASTAPAELGHVHAHGLGTRTCDLDESQALASVFGTGLSKMPVTAAKSYFGNLGAASGLVELTASILALREGALFPILNYQTPDPECPILAVREHGVRAGSSFANISVTPQGQASCVVVGLPR